jgi:hypothetical protein
MAGVLHETRRCPCLIPDRAAASAATATLGIDQIRPAQAVELRQRPLSIGLPLNGKEVITEGYQKLSSASFRRSPSNC